MKDYFGKDLAPLKEKKLFLFDMDGTIYLGSRLFDGVIELLQKIKNDGGRYVFITNNSSQSVVDYVAKLKRMGIEDVDEENFFTSTQAAVMIMKEKFGTDLIYAQGTRSFITELKSSGLTVTEEYTTDAKCILVGFDREITGEKMWNTCKMLGQDLPYYAANPDWVCPVDFGFIPDCGWMCKGYEMATGKSPVFIGKPQPTMIEVVMKKFGVEKEKTLVIGDRIYTDIKSGLNAGVDALCVLSGEVTLDEVKESAADEKPTYTLDSVAVLLQLLKE